MTEHSVQPMNISIAFVLVLSYVGHCKPPVMSACFIHEQSPQANDFDWDIRSVKRTEIT